MKSLAIKSLVLTTMVCGTMTAIPANAADSAALPACGATNFDAARNLYTITNPGVTVSRTSGEPLDAKGAVLPTSSMPLNQQCLLTVMPGGLNNGDRVAAGRYTVYFSDGGDGGAGGTTRYNGGGGGGAGAQQKRVVIDLTPGTYKLVIGAGGPGGTACQDVLSGGPGWPGSPTALISLSANSAIVGRQDADTWKRPSRRELETMKGNIDGHGGNGPGKAPGGRGGFNVAGNAYGATNGGNDQANWTSGKPGDNGGGESPRVASGIGAGGGGGAALGDGGDGAGLNAVATVPVASTLPVSQNAQSAPPPPKSQTRMELPEMGGLGAGGGGGLGQENHCTAGAPGGPGYIAFRQG